MTAVRHALIVAAVAGATMLINLGGPKLWDRDEPRNAGCAAEMLARGDWVVPVFNAELRSHKPVLLYWLMMTAYGAFGISEFSARLPSALLAIGTALCTWDMGRRLFSPRAGLWAGLSISTSLLFVVAGRAATPDSALIFLSTLAVAIFARWSFSAGMVPEAKLPWSVAAPMYGVMGLAMLAKGPVGLLFPTAVIGLFQLITSSFPGSAWEAVRRFFSTCWSLRPITAIVVALAVAAPWYAWVGLRTNGEFLRGFFLDHNLNRAMQPMEGHRGNVLFYPLTILVGFFPWSVFAVPLAIDAVRGSRKQGNARATVFAVSWIAVYVGFFTLAKTKLPSYITPCFPALALLLGAFVDRCLSGEQLVSDRWRRAAFGVFAMVGLAFIMAVPFVAHRRLPGEEWLGAIGVVPLLAGGFGWWFSRTQQAHRAAGTFAAGAVSFVTLLFAVGADRAGAHQLAQRLWQSVAEQSTEPRVAAFACLEPSWVFYGRRSIDEITHNGYGPTHSPFHVASGRWEPKPVITIDSVVSQPGDLFVVTTNDHADELRKLLPNEFRELNRVPFFLKDQDLVLFGRTRAGNIASAKHTARDLE